MVRFVFKRNGTHKEIANSGCLSTLRAFLSENNIVDGYIWDYLAKQPVVTIDSDGRWNDLTSLTPICRI